MQGAHVTVRGVVLQKIEVHERRNSGAAAWIRVETAFDEKRGASRWVELYVRNELAREAGAKLQEGDFVQGSGTLERTKNKAGAFELRIRIEELSRLEPLGLGASARRIGIAAAARGEPTSVPPAPKPWRCGRCGVTDVGLCGCGPMGWDDEDYKGGDDA